MTDSSVNFGNHRYTDEQNCILFICKCNIKKSPPPPIPKLSYGLELCIYVC